MLRNVLNSARPAARQASVVAQQQRNISAAAVASQQAAWRFPVHPATQAPVEPKEVVSEKLWTSKTHSAEDFRQRLPEEVHREIHNYVKKIGPQTSNVDDAVIDPAQLTATQKCFKELERKNIFGGKGAMIVEPVDGLNSVHEMRLATYVLTNLIGKALVQNAEGQKSILVYDRNATVKMADGARYHQSHEGGGLHTDNVNVPDIWESMLLTCLQPAWLGGESIIVSTTAVHNHLAREAPNLLSALQTNYLFECRGVNDSFYTSPILFYNKQGDPCFRYLRSYMENAHKVLKYPLAGEQLAAIDAVDTIGELSDYQIRFQARAGETLWCNDVLTLHGRTRFQDRGATSQDYDIRNPVNRLYQRTWIKTDCESRDVNEAPYVLFEAADVEEQPVAAAN